MKNPIQITVQVRALNQAVAPADVQRMERFIMQGVELGVSQVTGEVQSFDPHTGEPIVSIPWHDTDPASLISTMTVMSPTAMHGALTQIPDEEDYLTIEPITFSFDWGDDDV